MDGFILFTKLITLLLLIYSVQYASCGDVYIIPTPKSPCPGAAKGEPCFTLQQYVTNHNLSSNTTLNFYSGKHHMESQLSVSNVNSFTMRASRRATILCNQKQTYDDYWFTFEYIETVQIRGIAFSGCWISADVGNLVVLRSSFVNATSNECCSRGGVLDIAWPSGAGQAMIKQCVFSDNTRGPVITDYSHNITIDQCTFFNNYDTYNYHAGAIYKNFGQISILNSYFSHNEANHDGGAVYILAGEVKVTIANSHFSENIAGANGGAVRVCASPVVIINSTFSDNKAKSNNSLGGALYACGSYYGVIISNNFFSDNAAGHINGNGGAVYIEGTSGFRVAVATDQIGNITFSGNTFVNNMASGGGAIYSGIRYPGISLKNNTFSHNTASYCGAMQIDQVYHYSATFIGNTFTHNRAIGKVAGSDRGGVICIRKASALILDNIFHHNTAAGDAGVLQVEESVVTIKRSRFDNNAAGGNGGVLHTDSLLTNYTIIQSFFTYNQAGGDGGVMYVGRAGSQVKIHKGVFGYNHAIDRGGVITINGSVLQISGASICKKNFAELGGVISACKSTVRISNTKISITPDPTCPFCTLYDCTS